MISFDLDRFGFFLVFWILLTNNLSAFELEKKKEEKKEDKMQKNKELDKHF